MTALPIPLDPRVVAAGLAAVLAGEGLRRSARETYNYLEDTTRRSNHNRPLTPPAPVTGSYERGDNNATEGAAAAHPTLFDLCSLTTPEFRSQLSQAIREPPMSIPSQEEGYSGIEIPFPFRVPCATSPPPVSYVLYKFLVRISSLMIQIAWGKLRLRHWVWLWVCT